MKTVKLLQSTRVQLEKGTSVNVSDFEAWRLVSFGLAEEHAKTSSETAKKSTTTKKTTK